MGINVTKLLGANILPAQRNVGEGVRPAAYAMTNPNLQYRLEALDKTYGQSPVVAGEASAVGNKFDSNRWLLGI